MQSAHIHTQEERDTHLSRGSHCELVVQPVTNAAALCPHTGQRRRTSLCVRLESKESTSTTQLSLLPALEATRPLATFKSASISGRRHVQRPKKKKKKIRLELVPTNILLRTANVLYKFYSLTTRLVLFIIIVFFFFFLPSVEIALMRLDGGKKKSFSLRHQKRIFPLQESKHPATFPVIAHFRTD